MHFFYLGAPVLVILADIARGLDLRAVRVGFWAFRGEIWGVFSLLLDEA